MVTFEEFCAIYIFQFQHIVMDKEGSGITVSQLLRRVTRVWPGTTNYQNHIQHIPHSSRLIKAHVQIKAHPQSPENFTVFSFYNLMLRLKPTPTFTHDPIQ